ncbi:hypothetical protein GCM10011574_04630 [Microbispora bryophytorum]|uniref:Uncharacterized protein n=1 Tax=Microbispora bryophytorum TaxID=1460882 RepID=A0A8H9LB61_9ACTN|nr:hypothetical protein GCM10011574_04630 [Microbispora bryophytorum]
MGFRALEPQELLHYRDKGAWAGTLWIRPMGVGAGDGDYTMLVFVGLSDRDPSRFRTALSNASLE